jgi:hypothetical protein
MMGESELMTYHEAGRQCPFIYRVVRTDDVPRVREHVVQ